MKRYCPCSEEHCCFPDCRHGDLELWRDEAPDLMATAPGVVEQLLFWLAMSAGSFALLVWWLV
jgi:hypothetical protein